MNPESIQNIVYSYSLRNIAQSSPYILDLLSDDPNYYIIMDLHYYYNEIIRTTVLEKQDYKCAICKTETAEYLFEKWQPIQETANYTRLVLEEIIGVCYKCLRKLNRRALKYGTENSIWSPHTQHKINSKAKINVNFDLAYLSNFDEDLYREANSILNQLRNLEPKGILLDIKGQLILSATMRRQCDPRKIIQMKTLDLLNAFKKHISDTRVKLDQETLLRTILIIKEKFVEMILQELKKKCLEDSCDQDTWETGLRLQSYMNQVKSVRLSGASSLEVESFLDKIVELETEMHIEHDIERILEFYPSEFISRELKHYCSAHWYFYSPSDSVFKIVRKLCEESAKRPLTIIISNKRQKQQIVKIEINNMFSPEEIEESVKALDYFETTSEPKLYSKADVGVKKPILSLPKSRNS